MSTGRTRQSFPPERRRFQWTPFQRSFFYVCLLAQIRLKDSYFGCSSMLLQETHLPLGPAAVKSLFHKSCCCAQTRELHLKKKTLKDRVIPRWWETQPLLRVFRVSLKSFCLYRSHSTCRWNVWGDQKVQDILNRAMQAKQNMLQSGNIWGQTSVKKFWKWRLKDTLLPQRHQHEKQAPFSKIMLHTMYIHVPLLVNWLAESPLWDMVWCSVSRDPWQFRQRVWRRTSCLSWRIQLHCSPKVRVKNKCQDKSSWTLLNNIDTKFSRNPWTWQATYDQAPVLECCQTRKTLSSRCWVYI